MITLLLAALPILGLDLRPMVQFAPGRIETTIEILRHPDNVQYDHGWMLCVDEACDLEENFAALRRSSVHLDGLYSQVHFYHSWRDLPPGYYLAFVDLYRAADGKVTRVARKTVPFRVLESIPR